MFILMILYDFCMLPAQFCYIILYIQKVESCVQITDLRAPWKISSGVKNLLLQARRKHRSSFAVQLLLKDDVMYSIVACTAIGMDCV
jgi:hypothetical protein